MELKIRREDTKSKSAHRRGHTRLIVTAAACIMLALGACAVGPSIHRQRQDALREQLGVEENAASVDREQPVPVGETKVHEGVTLLSASNDGQFLEVHVNVCPVEPVVVNTFGSSIDNGDGTLSLYAFYFTGDGENLGIADPFAAGADSIDELLAGAYDEASRTLTLMCCCSRYDFPFDKPFDLSFQLHYETVKPDGSYDTELIQTFGTITVDPTDSAASDSDAAS